MSQFLQRLAETTTDPLTAALLELHLRGGSAAYADLQAFLTLKGRADRFDAYLNKLRCPVNGNAIAQNGPREPIHLLPAADWRLIRRRLHFAQHQPDLAWESGLAEARAAVEAPPLAAPPPPAAGTPPPAVANCVPVPQLTVNPSRKETPKQLNAEQLTGNVSIAFIGKRSQGKAFETDVLNRVRNLFAQAMGHEEAKKEMEQSGAWWRIICRAWPDELERALGELSYRLKIGPSVDHAPGWLTDELKRYVGFDVWERWRKIAPWKGEVRIRSKQVIRGP